MARPSFSTAVVIVLRVNFNRVSAGQGVLGSSNQSQRLPGKIYEERSWPLSLLRCRSRPTWRECGREENRPSQIGNGE